MFSAGETFNFNFSQTAIAAGDLNGVSIPDLVVAVSSGTDAQLFPASVVVFWEKEMGLFRAQSLRTRETCSQPSCSLTLMGTENGCRDQ